jgi:hypothetical protein
MTVSISGATISGGVILGDINNVVPYPLDIFAWASGAGTNGCTISRDAGTSLSPAGGIPMKMTVTGADPHIGTYNSVPWNLAPAAVGQTWRASVYAKASVSTSAGIFIFGCLSDGTYVEAPAGGGSVSTSWSLITYTHTFTNPSTVFVQTRLDGADDTPISTEIWFDQYMLYRVS